MNTYSSYIPNALIQALAENCISDYPSDEPVSALSRGIRLLDKNEALIEGYLYTGYPEDLKYILSEYEQPSFPVCVLTAGRCSFFNKDFSRPSDLFLIETKLELIPLYNQVQDCYHRNFNYKPSHAGVVISNQAFQDLIDDILDEKLVDSEEIEHYLKKNNINPSKFFRIFAIVFSSTTNKGSIAWNYIISYLQKVFPSSYLATYNGRIIILDRHVHVNKDFSSIKNKILPILEQYDGFMGIGNICAHLTSVPAVYSQIITSVRLGTKINPNERFFCYEDYAMLHMVELTIQASAMSMHSRNPIHLMNNEAVKLIEYDNKHSDNLIEILDCFLRHNCNLKETSDALFIHRNTLRNKIDKIEQVMGVPLGDPIFEERLRFSCSTYRYVTQILKENPLELRRNSDKIIY